MIVHGYRPWGKALTDIKRRERLANEAKAEAAMKAVQMTDAEVELKFPTASGKPVKGVPIAGIEHVKPTAPPAYSDRGNT